jgi:hypothetical protein
MLHVLRLYASVPPFASSARGIHRLSGTLFECSSENGVLTAAEHIQSSLPLEALRCDGCKTHPARVWACHKLQKLCPHCVKVNTCRTILWSPFCLCNLSLCPHHVRVSNIVCVRFSKSHFRPFVSTVSLPVQVKVAWHVQLMF